MFTFNSCRVAAADMPALREILTTYVAAVRADEPGCRGIRVLVQADDPQAVTIVAEYVDQAAYDAHLGSRHLAALRAAIHPLIGDSHRKTIFHPLLETTS